MKKLLVLLFIWAMIPATHAENPDYLASNYENEVVNLSLRRKSTRRMQVEREIDSLIMNRDFMFRPSRLDVRGTGRSRNVNWSRADFFSIRNGWIDSRLIYGGINNDFNITNNFRVTRSVKDGNIWFFDIEINKINELVTARFVIVADTGRAVLTMSSNRRGGHYIYTGYIVRN